MTYASGIFMSEIAARSIDLPDASKDQIASAVATLSAAKEVEDARAALQSVEEIIANHAPNEKLYIAHALTVERTRPTIGLREFWEDLVQLYPRNLVALRLAMRWYRRDRLVQGGLDRLNEWLPDADTNVDNAIFALAGLAELNAIAIIEKVIPACLHENPDRDDLRWPYIRLLAKQSHFMRAQHHVNSLVKSNPVSPSDKALVAEIAERAALQAEFCDTHHDDVIARAIELVAEHVPLVSRGACPRRISFFTGTLGQGGAELQMTRIAVGLQNEHRSDFHSDHSWEKVACDIVVRSAREDRRDGFFRQALEDAGIPVTSLIDTDRPDLAEIAQNDPLITKLLKLLPEPISETTLKLARHYKNINPDAAYLWQDGAVLDGCLAALIAGVPAIVTSFRGLPPGIRPELDRPHMKEAFRALSALPNVVFTANSQIVATAYENWLGLEKNTVKVIFNAAPVLSADGSEEDEAIWRGITQSSADCDQTVLGIFRHDHNKRPHLWIEIAERTLMRLPHVRFVILGDGTEFDTSHRMVKQKGLTDRIFMPGVRRNVGYYLNRSDLLMHVSLMEGLPNALLEAHTAGLPVLTTPAGGAQEVVSHGKSGFILDSAREVSLTDAADALSNMLSDPENLKRMGKCAKDSISKPFELSLVLRRTIDVLVGVSAR